MRTFRQGLSLLDHPQRRRWPLLVVLAVFVSGLEMVGAVLVFVLLSLVVDSGGSIDLPLLGDLRRYFQGAANDTILLGVATAMGCFFVFRAAIQVSAAYLQYRMAHNAGAQLSKRLVWGYLNMPYGLHLRRSSSEMIRNGHQATHELVTSVFLPTIVIVAESVLTIGLLSVLLSVDIAATGLAALLVGAAAGILLTLVQPRLKRLSEVGHRTTEQVLQNLQEAFQGVRDIKIFQRERFVYQRYARVRGEFARAYYLRATIGALPSVVMELALLGFILIAFGIAVAADGDASDILTVIGLFGYIGFRLKPSLQRLTAAFNSLAFSVAPLADLRRDLDLIEKLTVQPRGSALDLRDELELESVGYRYEGSNQFAIEGVNLKIRAGETIGVCGPTGGGKTTLVHLLTGLLEPTAGRIVIDGVELAGREQDWLASLGVVPQDVYLIDDSLRSNIVFGLEDEPIDEDALERAVASAQLKDLISGLPSGLDTMVGERGVRLSGGQRQRIAIARALYREPQMLVFDEGTSALDNVTEAELMRAVEAAGKDRTVIMIAHRLSTLRDADQVIVVEEGRVTGVGSFGSLADGHDGFRAMLQDRGDGARDGSGDADTIGRASDRS